MPEVTIPLKISIEIPEDKKVTVGNISTAVRDIEINKMIVEEVVHNIDKQKVKEYCGPKYERGNGDKRYQRAGTCDRTVVTKVGKLNLNRHTVEDTSKDEDKFFKPVEDVVIFDGKKIYQEDISMASVELATKMTYRDAKKEGELFTSMPSPSTINRRAIEYGEEIQDFNDSEIIDNNMDIVIPDSTKIHSQDKERDQHDVNITLGSEEDDKTSLLDANVNCSWEDTAEKFNESNAVDDKASIVSDRDREMINSLVTGERKYQSDFIHLVGTTSYYLWKDGELDLKDRKNVKRKLESILYTLKNSVEKHSEDDDKEALNDRIDKTVDSLKNLAERLSRLGCPKASGFIRDCSNSAVTFAKLAVKGTKIPWTSNVVERLMGEISKRCKHKWMRWTTKGLESLLNILLVRYTSEEKYDRFKGNIMKSEREKEITSDVKVMNLGVP